MKIKKIKLKCWQKHSDLTLDFNDGVNVISGLTGTGKSCIRRAIAWVLGMESISETDFRKEGTNETSVAIVLDNGFEVEKIRSNTLNRYILRHEGAEDKVFDAVGKDVPEEIQKVIEVKTIEIEKESIALNIANQIALPFLLDHSASFRAKLFNKLTGHEILDAVFKELNKESLSVNRDIKDTEEKIKTQEEELGNYSLKYKELNMKLNLVKNKFQDIKEQIKIYEQMVELAGKIKTNKEGQEFVAFKISKIKLIAEDMIKELKEKSEQFKKLRDLFHELEAINEDLQYLEQQKKAIKVITVDFEGLKKKDAQLKQLQNLFISLQNTNTNLQSVQDKKLSIKVVDVNFDELKKKNELYDTLKQWYSMIEQNKEKQNLVTKQIKEKQDLLGKKEQELKNIWKSTSTCPLCRQDIKHDK